MCETNENVKTYLQEKTSAGCANDEDQVVSLRSVSVKRELMIKKSRKALIVDEMTVYVSCENCYF